jgi:hypothetical protein
LCQATVTLMWTPSIRVGHAADSDDAGQNGYVTGTYHVRDPEKLSRVERETTTSR